MKASKKLDTFYYLNVQDKVYLYEGATMSIGVVTRITKQSAYINHKIKIDRYFEYEKQGNIALFWSEEAKQDYAKYLLLHEITPYLTFIQKKGIELDRVGVSPFRLFNPDRIDFQKCQDNLIKLKKVVKLLKEIQF